MSLRPVPPLGPDELGEEARALYEEILASRTELAARGHLVAGDGSLRGPFDALLRAPSVGGPVQRVGQALRDRSTLHRAVRETAVLTVAQAWRAGYVWVTHEQVVRASALLDDAAIAAIRRGAAPEHAPPGCVLAWSLCRRLLERRGIDRETFERARAELGIDGLVELTVLVGYYSLLAMLLDAFEVPPDFE